MHRPHVSGIHGKESESAYSIVLAGGYEDDEVRTKFSSVFYFRTVTVSTIKI